MSIESKGLLINEAGPKDNPRELEYFEHQIKFSDPMFFCSHQEWKLIGDIPNGIKINKDTGQISGVIKEFFNQNNLDNKYPDEEMEYDGSNWMNNGRFKPLFYDFHFTVIRNTLISGPNPSTGAMDCKIKIPYIETSDVFIKLIKCHNIDNLLFIKKYLESSKRSKNGILGTMINIDGKSYTNYEDAVKKHPGPFKCS